MTNYLDVNFFPLAALKVNHMAEFLLQKFPELLLGGDSLRNGAQRCQDFWEKFRGYQPSHDVFKHHSKHLSNVIPICIHGDKGRMLRKSPIAVYSWESIWGLPDEIRNTSEESGLAKRQVQKYDTGRLGQTCAERMFPKQCCDADGCTIHKRRLGDHGERLDTHNSLGNLVYIIYRLCNRNFAMDVLENLQYIILTKPSMILRSLQDPKRF